MQGLDQKLFDQLFERAYKPFRSRNARTLFNIFIVEKEKEHLTTLDIQTHLDEIGIDLSKKEINAWLRSLQEADLITKEQERGKPTTLVYDDKYTFDKWSLSEKGLNVSEDLRELISGTIGGEQYNNNLSVDDRAVTDTAAPSQDDGSLQASYLQSLLLSELRRSSGIMQRNELLKKLIPEDAELDYALSALIEQGLIDVKKRKGGGFLTRVLVTLGLKPEDREVHLTEKGHRLPG
jgi:DNA-binding transcriptional ArsR family regulator